MLCEMQCFTLQSMECTNHIFPVDPTRKIQTGCSDVPVAEPE